MGSTYYEIKTDPEKAVQHLSLSLSLSLSLTLHLIRCIRATRNQRMISEPLVIIAVDSPREQKKEKSQGPRLRKTQSPRALLRKGENCNCTQTQSTPSREAATEENLARGTTLAANRSSSSLEGSRCGCIGRRRWRPKVVPFEAGVPLPMPCSRF